MARIVKPEGFIDKTIDGWDSEGRRTKFHIHGKRRDRRPMVDFEKLPTPGFTPWAMGDIEVSEGQHISLGPEVVLALYAVNVNLTELETALGSSLIPESREDILRKLIDADDESVLAPFRAAWFR